MCLIICPKRDEKQKDRLEDHLCSHVRDHIHDEMNLVQMKRKRWVIFVGKTVEKTCTHKYTTMTIYRDKNAEVRSSMVNRFLRNFSSWMECSDFNQGEIDMSANIFSSIQRLENDSYVDPFVVAIESRLKCDRASTKFAIDRRNP